MASGTKITLVIIVALLIGTGAYWAAVGPGPARTTAATDNGAPGTGTGATAPAVTGSATSGTPSGRGASATDRGAGRTAPTGGAGATGGPGASRTSPSGLSGSAGTSTPGTRTTPGSGLPGSASTDAGGRDTSTPPDVRRPELSRPPNLPTPRPGITVPGSGSTRGTIDTTPRTQPPIDPSTPVEDVGKELPPPGTTGAVRRGEQSGRDEPVGPPTPVVTPPTTGGDPDGSTPSRSGAPSGRPAAPTAPATPANGGAGTSAPNYTTYVIREGDTMVLIAEEWFGDAGKWDLIAKANPYVDPTRLRIGDTLRLPPKDAVRETPRVDPAPSGAGTMYTIRSGDTLSSIARLYYGSSAAWRTIYDANRDVIGSDPAVLKVGTTLRIPPPGGR